MTKARRIMLVFATAIRAATAGEAPDFAETTVIDAPAGETATVGVVSDGTAAGTATPKGGTAKVFAAELE